MIKCKTKESCQQHITLPTQKLNLSFIMDSPALPIISKHAKQIIIDVQQIDCIDACGLSWLMNLVQKYSRLGFKVSITDNSVVSQAIHYLGLEKTLSLVSPLQNKAAV